MNVEPFVVVFVAANSHTWATSTLQDARHHRHWQRVLGQVGGLHLSTLCFPLPMSGTVLGGTMELHGNNISLACFHGINFKSKSWALFSLKEPCISFATEAQEVPSPDCKCRTLSCPCHYVRGINVLMFSKTAFVCLVVNRRSLL
jgi:hypothetical protein